MPDLGLPEGGMWELGDKRDGAGNREVSLATGDVGTIDTGAGHLAGLLEPIPGMGGLLYLGQPSRPVTRRRTRPGGLSSSRLRGSRQN